MLYPNFDELAALKNWRSNLIHPSPRFVASAASGNYQSPFRGKGLEFDSVREYVPGDDIRNIDWRVTARTGSPHVKLFKEDRERNIFICVDMNATMRFGTRNTFKSVQAARTAALLGWGGIAHHDRISACLFGDVLAGIQFFSPKRTRKSFCSILKTLSQPPAAQHAISLEKALSSITRVASAGSLIYIISDFMDVNENFQPEACLSRLSKKCDVVFIAINDLADKAIYPVGTIGFCSHGPEKIYVNTDSLAGKEAYAAQWKENRRQLYEISRKLKIQLLELTTQSDLRRDLLLGLKNIAKRKKR